MSHIINFSDRWFTIWLNELISRFPPHGCVFDFFSSCFLSIIRSLLLFVFVFNGSGGSITQTGENQIYPQLFLVWRNPWRFIGHLPLWWCRNSWNLNLAYFLMVTFIEFIFNHTIKLLLDDSLTRSPSSLKVHSHLSIQLLNPSFTLVSYFRIQFWFFNYHILLGFDGMKTTLWIHIPSIGYS